MCQSKPHYKCCFFLSPAPDGGCSSTLWFLRLRIYIFDTRIEIFFFNLQKCSCVWIFWSENSIFGRVTFATTSEQSDCVCFDAEFLVSIVIRFWVNALGFRWKIPIFILKINQYYSNWYSNTTHTNTRMMKILWSCLGKSFQTAESISDVLIICWLVAILSVICVAFVQFRFQLNLTPATSRKSLKYYADSYLKLENSK